VSNQKLGTMLDLMSWVGKPHPWHGPPLGPDVPRVVTTNIEIVPDDTVKYELDKLTGPLKVNRPQYYSNVSPMWHGSITRTFSSQVSS